MFDLTCRSVSIARQCTNTSAPTFGHTHDRSPDVRHLGLNHSTLRPPWPLAIWPPWRSTIRPPERSTFRPFGLICSNIQPRTRSAVGLNDVRPLGLHPFASVVRRFAPKQIQHSFSRALGLKRPTLSLTNSASTARPSIATTAPPCDPIDVRPPALDNARQSLYERSSSRPFDLLIVSNRSTISVRAFKQSAVRPPYCFRPLDNLCERTFKQSIVRPPFGFNRSTIPVNERSSSRPFGLLLVSTARQSMYERSNSRPFGLNGIRPLISSARQCTTIHAYERSSSWPFGLKAIRPLISSARQCTTISVRAFKQSAVRPPYCFQLLDNPCERTFKQSTVRPPFGFNRSTIPVYERSSSRPFGLKDISFLSSLSLSFLSSALRLIPLTRISRHLCHQPHHFQRFSHVVERIPSVAVTLGGLISFPLAHSREHFHFSHQRASLSFLSISVSWRLPSRETSPRRTAFIITASLLHSQNHLYFLYPSFSTESFIELNPLLGFLLLFTIFVRFHRLKPCFHNQKPFPPIQLRFTPINRSIIGFLLLLGFLSSLILCFLFFFDFLSYFHCVFSLEEASRIRVTPTVIFSKLLRGFASRLQSSSQSRSSNHPYLNTDAGTMSPFEHGEVFVLDDGGEGNPCDTYLCLDSVGTSACCSGASDVALHDTLIVAAEPNLKESTARKKIYDRCDETVRIAMVGKYTGLSDAYLSVLKGADGVLVPGSFGDGGVQGLAAKYA
ncbi:hypothetical protein LR48_Vigan05g132600 [Vigna angularis]|uniref:CTP synthase N-terminal domain-containing protein n=1 Tax=Phaseolus angularis TaxID=3914 RepID=A0A0L9ULZ3_PHAAN|nr:hypothetical protein LR48_Vigan05g132600 [Vigna angularis]